MYNNRRHTAHGNEAAISREARELAIGADLAKRGIIEDQPYRVWLQRRKTGKSFRQLRPMFRHAASTLWKWYQAVQFAVEREDGPQDEQESAPLEGTTIHRPGAWPTETPLLHDPCLKRLGI